MIERKSGLYQIVNIVNGMKYVGSSCNLHHRWISHRSELRLGNHSNDYLQKAWNKYGEDSFVFEITKEDIEEDQLLIEEQKEIDKYNFKQDLYNLAPIAGKPKILKGEAHLNAILKEKQVNQIREEYPQNRNVSMVEIGKQYGVSKPAIQAIIANTSWYDPTYTPVNNHFRVYYEGKNDVLKTTQEEYIEKARAIHGDKYDYSKVEYTTNNHKIIIICPIHGEFSQFASGHAPGGKGCKQCATNVIKSKLKYTFEEFVRTAEFVHGKDHYEYPIQELDSRIKIKIYCKIHDLWFEQRMNAHLCGDGCGKCGQLKRVASRNQKSKGGS